MIFDRVKEILCDEFGIESDQVTSEAALTDDLDLDGTDLIDLAMSVEDEFEMELPDEALEAIVTVADLVKYIEEH